MNKRKYAQLSLSLAAMLMAVPVWAAEQNNSAADVVANQTMTIGGKEQIVSQKALEQMREAQEKEGKSFPKKGKDGKYTYYMHNKPSEDISDPNYKSGGKSGSGRIVEIVPGHKRKLLKRRTAALHRCRMKPLLPMKATARLPQGKMAS